MNGQALIPRTTLDVDDAATAKRTQQFLKHKGGLFPADMSEGQAAVLARLSLLYSLDPFSDDLILLQGKPYLTLKGALRIANDHLQFDGLECEPATFDERKAFRARDDEELWVCRVWRKDRRVPMVGYGRASASDDQPVARRWPQELASKRARHRALRDAFSLPVPGLEEGDGAPERVVARVVEPGELGPEPVRADQVKAIHAIARSIGWLTKEDASLYREALRVTFGVQSSTDLTAGQASAFIETLAAEQEGLAVYAELAEPDLVDQRLTLAERANEVGMTTLQLQGLIEAQYGQGTTINSLGAPQIVTLMELLAVDDAPIEEQTAELKW